MDLGTFASRFNGVRWSGDEKFRAHCPCLTHRDGDPSCSLVARVVSGRIIVACFADLGDSTETILTAVGLTSADLRAQTSSGLPPKAPAAAFSANGATNGSNGHVEPPQTPAFGKWQVEVGYQFKQWFGSVPENERELLASTEENTLVDTLVTQAKDWIANQKRPLWPLPELAEWELEEELHRLAEAVVKAFRDDYLPAIAENHLPDPTGVIDRTPIDAWEAYQQIRADVREYSWEGLIRESCTMVLTALMGAGKTTLSMNIARGWALGETVLGRKCKPSRTLVVVSPKEFEAWADTIGFWGLKGAIYLIASHKTHFDQGATAQAHWFEETMRKYECRTFILDTLFDFFGLPPRNTGDSNRIAMAEQTPLLEAVRVNCWSGIGTGHSPKSEAQAPVPRDPEEAFAGHTAWTAQHRMRAVIRRKAKGVNAFITGRGGYGDLGILDEHKLVFDEETRLVSLGGKFAEYLGETALPVVIAALEGGWMGRSDLIKATGKGKNFIYAGVKYGLKQGGPDGQPALKWNEKAGRAAKYALPNEPDEWEQQDLMK